MSNNLFTDLKPTIRHSFLLYILKATQAANKKAEKAPKAREALNATKAQQAKARTQERTTLGTH